MLINLEQAKSIQKCDCPRPWCEFFSGSISECGSSFNRNQIKDMIQIQREHQRDSEKIIRCLKKLLKK